MKDQTQQEKRAAADAAKEAADNAQAAFQKDPQNADLKKKAEDSQKAADDAEEAAKAPLHDTKPTRSNREKGEKRIEILLSEVNKQRIAEGLKPLSIEEYQEGGAHAATDIDEDGDDEDNKNVTMGDLKRAGVIKTAEQLASDIKDEDTRASVLDELKHISKNLPPEQRYQKALAIASSGKNTRVAQEIARMGNRRVATHVSGGAPARADDENFEPTPQERVYMDKYKLTKEQVLDSRKQASNFDFGKGQK